MAPYIPPTASEAMYFHNEPVRHIVQFQERERLARIDRTARAAVARKRVTKLGGAL
jgi:hypothetical protein